MHRIPFAQTPALAPLFGPPALVPDESLTDQAARLADHVLVSAPHLPPRYVTRKVLDAVALSLANGHRDLAVPTKLVGVAAHQLAVEALLAGEPHARPGGLRPGGLRPGGLRPGGSRPGGSRPGGLRLLVAADMTAHAVRSDGSLRPLGRLQPRHDAWLAPLLDRGALVHVHAVTGLSRRTRGLHVTLGVNVTVSGLAHALRNLQTPPPLRVRNRKAVMNAA